MATYGYVRVSTREQNADRQIFALQECGLKIEQIIVDKESGKDFERKQYKKLIRKLKAGDLIIIKSIDRLGRNYNEIQEQWRIITKQKKADIKVLDMAILDTSQNKDLLGTFISDLVLQLLSYVAENERTNIRQRQAEGITAAKARGVHFGRSQQYHYKNYIDIFNMALSGEITNKEAIQRIGCCENTFYKMLREIKNSNTNLSF